MAERFIRTCVKINGEWQVLVEDRMKNLFVRRYFGTKPTEEELEKIYEGMEKGL